MKFLSTWIGLLVFFSFIAIESSDADNRRPSEPPAKHPNFQLMESSDTHVVIQYERPPEDPLLKTDHIIFVGIPIDATYAIQFDQWDASLMSKRTIIDRLSSRTPSPGDASFSIETVLPSFAPAERFAYQELDVLRIKVPTYVDMPNSQDKSSYSRNQVIPDRLVFRIDWQGGAPRPIQNSSTLDAGYNRLYRSLLINAENALAMRSKRVLPEGEKTQGFHPRVVGFTASAVPRSASEAQVHRADAMKVRTRAAGITAIRRQDVAQQGVDPQSVQLNQARLWDRGVEVPVSIQDDGDGVLGEADAIYFYARKSDSEYTNDRIYFLTWFPMDSLPLRVEQKPVEWAEAGAEEFLAHWVLDEDHALGKDKGNQYTWFYQTLEKQETIVPLDLTGILPTRNVEVRVRMVNNSRAKSDVTFALGGNEYTASVQVGEATTALLTFPAAGLVENATLQILLGAEPDGVSTESRGMSAKPGEDTFIFIDSIEAIYPSRADFSLRAIHLESQFISAATRVVTLQGGEAQGGLSAWVIQNGVPVQRLTAPELPQAAHFRVPDATWDQIEIVADTEIPSPYTMDRDYASSLHAKEQGYNYVIISHEIFLKEARRLEEIRRDEGFEVLRVDVQDIYDEFYFGYPDSDAIRRFLRYAQSEWSGPSPEFVSLIGDSSWDHKDREGTGSVDQIPTYAPENSPQKDGSDEWYAYLWGENADYFSDAIVGRISVRKPEELARYIDKLIIYENESPVGPWKMKNIFITDDTFETYSRESARESLPPPFVPGHIDQVEFPHVTNPYLYHRFATTTDPAAREYTNKKYSPDTTLAILDALNQGALIVQYIGHGGNQIWSHERVFYGTDRPYSNVLELNPTRKFPFIVNWSCLTGYLNFNVPPFNVCLAEEFIRYADKGGIAMWAPSGSGSTDQHMLMTHLVNRYLVHDGLNRLGEATTATKVEYLQILYHPELMNQYILFGDPGVKLAAPQETLNVTVEPSTFVTQQETPLQVQAQMEGFTEGKAIVALTVDGELKYQSEPLNLEKGMISHAFPFAFGEVEYPTATVSVYAWNEKQNLDAWGGTRLRKSEPVLILREGQAELSETESTLQFTVHNPTSFLVQSAEFLIQMDRQEASASLAEVPAGATVTVEWKGTIPENVHAAYVSVMADPLQGLPATKPSERLAIPIVKDLPVPILPLIGQINFPMQELIEGVDVHFNIPFKSFSMVEEVTALVFLKGPGSATETHEINLRPLETRMLDFSAEMPPLGEYEYMLTVQWNNQEQVYSIPLQVWGKPDLLLAEGEFRVEPAQPVVGRSVTIFTTVYNMGEGPATDVSVSAFDGDPSQNRRLQSFNNRRQPSIARLEPGESQEVEIIWDPTAFEGKGPHEIFVVVDSYERINESSEDNNRIHFPLVLADLPDLVVDYWMDHDLNTSLQRGMAVWGQPLTLRGRVRNNGASDAEYVRLTLLHNGEEITRFFPRIPPNGVAETTVDVPLVSAKNDLRNIADKYDLIGEQNEVDGQLGNNMSHEKRLYVQLQMPETPIENKKRVYRVERETEFAAGMSEFLIFDPRKEGLRLHPQMEDLLIHIQPAYVKNPEAFTSQNTSTQWHWNMKNNIFMSPTKKEEVLRVALPAPNGVYDVHLQLYSHAYEKNASATVDLKTNYDKDFINFTHQRNKVPRGFQKLKTYMLKDDQLLLEMRGVPGPFSTSVGDISFKRVPGETPIAAGYSSPFFPAAGSGTGFAEITWEADIPKETELFVKARWVNQEADGTFRYSPWSRNVDGRQKILRLPGKGAFLQYYVSFARIPREDISPVLKKVTVSIPAVERPGVASK